MSINFNKGPHRLQLSGDAQQYFFDWRNELSAQKHELPALVRGYIPKLVGYALRLSGALHLIKQFEKGEEPGRVLSLDDIRDGISLTMFYGGQAVSALRLLQDEEGLKVGEVSERTILLARVLRDLQGEVDSGRLAVGLIQEVYNAEAPETDRFRAARSMGTFLRSLGLTVSGRYTANGRRGVFCLAWDKTLADFIEDIADIEKQSPHTERPVKTGPEDFADIEDFIFSDEVIV